MPLCGAELSSNRMAASRGGACLMWNSVQSHCDGFLEDRIKRYRCKKDKFVNGKETRGLPTVRPLANIVFCGCSVIILCNMAHQSLIDVLVPTWRRFLLQDIYNQHVDLLSPHRDDAARWCLMGTYGVFNQCTPGKNKQN